MKRVLLTLSVLSTILLSACSFGGATPEPPKASAPAATTVPATTAAPTAAPANTAANAAATPTTAPAAGDTTQAVDTSGCTPGTGQVVTTASELKYEDLLICNGVEAKAGMTVAVNYIGTLKDGGTQFDNSYDRGKPIVFVLGLGQVIKGWDEGIAGMKVGSKRRLTIPPVLAYGNRSLPGIPAGSTLVFEVQLVSAK